jgi:hypothetical protein
MHCLENALTTLTASQACRMALAGFLLVVYLRLLSATAGMGSQTIGGTAAAHGATAAGAAGKCLDGATWVTRWRQLRKEAGAVSHAAVLPLEPGLVKQTP